MPRIEVGRQDLVCNNHPTRAGYGMCRRCQTVLCADCAAFAEGILTCPRCLAELAASESAGLVMVGDSLPACLFTIAFGTAGTTLVVYALLLLVR